jgi:hypothetical protein
VDLFEPIIKDCTGEVMLEKPDYDRLFFSMKLPIASGYGIS